MPPPGFRVGAWQGGFPRYRFRAKTLLIGFLESMCVGFVPRSDHANGCRSPLPADQLKSARRDTPLSMLAHPSTSRAP